MGDFRGRRRVNLYQSMKIKLLPLLLITAFWAVIGTGCNTTRGVGKDIEKAGDKIQDATR